MKNSSRAADLLHEFAGAIMGVAGAFEIPCVGVEAAAVRRHLTGRAKWGSRSETKEAVLRACRVLGLTPEGKVTHDQADACAVWDFAQAMFRARAPLWAAI